VAVLSRYSRARRRPRSCMASSRAKEMHRGVRLLFFLTAAGRCVFSVMADAAKLQTTCSAVRPCMLPARVFVFGHLTF